MWRLTIIASVAVVALARPDLYKETEDFQYSRSSSDDGTKSGFYGARRGNMGGNYERAHNMDGLAQHQMSTAVRQVEGELGEGAKTRTGSVYTAANSRGIFGSGHYDLSNLKGRNFEESESFGDSHSSLTSQNSGYSGQSYSAAHNAGYSSGFSKSSRQQSGYQSADYSDQYARNENAQAQDLYQANRQYSYGKHEATGRDYKYYSQGGSNAQNQYDYSQSNLQNNYDSNSYGRHPTDAPVSVIMKPGSIVTIPITARAQDASSYRDTSFNQNSVNSEAEVLDGSNQHIYVKPANAPKHYESSYSYRKEWEKHHRQPMAIMPTENPFPKNSELYDDLNLLQNAKSQLSTSETSNAHSSSANLAHSNSYMANTKTSSLSRSRYNSESQTQSGSAAAHSNAYTLGTHNAQQASDTNNLVEDLNSKPKSYHSSYSYHKSWERRGDPYVIKPVGGGVSSQRLVAASNNQGAFSSHQYGAQYNQDHQRYSQEGIDCDENGHIRVARSLDPNAYYNDQQQEQQFEAFQDMRQQVQDKWENLEDMSQQTQNLGQFAQNKWEDLGQQTQNQWDRLEDFGQETQNQWNNHQDQGQQNQNQSGDLQVLGQQTQDESDINQNIGQNIQNEWNTLQTFDHQAPSDITQQTQDDRFEHFHEQSANEDFIMFKPTINHKESSDKNNNQHSDTQNWNVINNFNTEQMTQFFGQKETSLNKKDEQVEQQNQFWNNFQEYKPNNNKNTDQDTPIQEQAPEFPYYNIGDEKANKTDDKRMPIQPIHYQNTHVVGSLEDENYDDLALNNLWNKLDKIENLYKNENRSEQKQFSYSNTQSTYHSWDKYDWQDSQSTYGENFFNFSSTNNIQKSSTENSKHEQSPPTSSIHNQKPAHNTFTTTIRNIPKHDSQTSQQHHVVPQGPIDIGRGDIGAEETVLDNTDIDNTDFIKPKMPNKPFKTPEEIESLSLISENQKTNDYHNLQAENNERQTIAQARESRQKHSHESNNVNNLQEVTSTTTVKSNIFTSSTQHSTDTAKNLDNLQNTNSHYNEQMFHQNQVVANKHHEERTQFDDKHKLPGYNNLEMAPIDVEQQNMDQQFEDFSQNLQGSFDFGQQLQSSWQPYDNFEQSDVQQLESFGQNQNDNKQDIQDQILEQQVENFEVNNPRNQNLMETAYFKPPNEGKEGRNQHTEPSKEPTEVFEESLMSKKIEQQETVPEKDTIATTIETPVEKPGFWKNVGNKLTNAKDSVVSWFKG